jgi:hypothetical protein
MGFEKGRKKTGGKPKGHKDEKTKAWEDLGEYITSRCAERAIDIMAKSSDKDFMLHFNNLLEYFKPKQARVEQNINRDEQVIKVTINE